MKWLTKLFRRKSEPILKAPHYELGIYSMVCSLKDQSKLMRSRISQKYGEDSYELKMLDNVISKSELILSKKTTEEQKSKYLASLTESIRKSGLKWR